MRKLLITNFILFICFTAFTQSAEDFYEKAKIKETNKDYQYAAVLIDKAIQLNSTNIWYWLKKADIQLNLNESNLAINYIKKAIALSPSSSEPYNRAGSFYNSRGLNDSAIYMFEKAIKFAENDKAKYSYITNRGTAKISVMNYEGALKDFKEVLKFQPNNIACLNNAAQMYKKTGAIDSALLLMNRVISIDKNDIGSHVNLGLLFTEIDSLDKALVYFSKAIAIAPDQPLIYSNRGFTYYKMGQYEKALSDINKSLEYYPTNSFAYKNLALVYFKMNLFQEGCKALKYAEYYGFKERYGNEVNELFDKNCN